MLFTIVCDFQIFVSPGTRVRPEKVPEFLSEGAAIFVLTSETNLKVIFIKILSTHVPLTYGLLQINQ